VEMKFLFPSTCTHARTHLARITQDKSDKSCIVSAAVRT